MEFTRQMNQKQFPKSEVRKINNHNKLITGEYIEI